MKRPSRYLGKAATLSRDAEAVARGRVGQRIANRLIGRAIGKMTRGLWRR